MNDNDLLWLTDRLPPVEKIELRGEPDYYGASHLIAAQLGQASPPPPVVPTWNHAWQYVEPVVHVRQIVRWGEADDTHLVGTEADVEMLKHFGFSKGVAVGVPFLYGDAVRAERQPGSLLVMPAHSLPYTEHGWDMDGYAEQIAQLRPHFSQIVACVSGVCVAKGYWTTSFDKQGIPWIEGASIDDKNALWRMNAIFRSFEYMTTNALGSHVAYAAYSGCRVSFYGTYAALAERDFQNAEYYQRYPEVLKAILASVREENIRARFPDLFVAPMHASLKQEWGAEVLGAKHRRPARDIARLLGWPDWRTKHLRPLLGQLKRKTAHLLGLRP